jgi:hypothetical protein
MLAHKAASGAFRERLNERGVYVREIDPNASMEALDVYHRLGILSDAQHQSGQVFRVLRDLIFGSPWPSPGWHNVVSAIVDGDLRRPVDELSEEDREALAMKREAKFQRANELLAGGPLRVLDGKRIVRAVCLDGAEVRQAELQALRWGLDVLAREWKIA